ncbi:hypothetical protein PVAP13_8KG047400 [Panicum virgatum]|uniref:Uncharacterized protein n=1 Tax=Panicum virgatum TaxID=38727 RepID=A0A8T0PHN3_PANVG|nr:hypothetical protein PVAP13_8KG047400 [Panicum virgatum]
MVCTAISRKLVEECIRPRFQAFAPVVHINGRHYLNVTTQNVQQKEHLKSQFLKEQSLGGKTNGREERFCECFGSCYPGCREGNPAWLCTIKCVESCAVNLREVPVAAFGVGDCSKICLSSICSAAETGTTDAGAAAACVDDCTVNWSLYKNKHT